jgi:hypothetical protein
MNITRPPISQRHCPEQPQTTHQIGPTRPLMQRQTYAPDDNQQRGDENADQHAGEDGEGKAGALRAPLNGQRRGGPDEDDAKIGGLEQTWFSPDEF